MDWLLHPDWQTLERVIVYSFAWIWPMITVALLVHWAVSTRLGFRRLAARPIRENYLQFPTVLVLFIAWFLLQLGLAEIARALLPGNMAAVYVAGAIAGLIAFFGAAWLSRWLFVRGRLGLGLAGRPVGRDILIGIGCVLLVMPLVMAVKQASLWISQLLHIAPSEHPLLKVAQQSPDTLTAAILLGVAALAAPLSEEILFRGILQSFLVRFFRLMMPPKGFPTMAVSPAPPEFQQIEAAEAVARSRSLGEQPPADLGALPGPESAGGQVAPLTGPQEARRAIAAIALTSLVFALIHLVVPTDMPALFVLALAIGYVYESTGSLVSAIAMHATFNAINMTLTLMGPHLLNPTQGH